MFDRRIAWLLPVLCLLLLLGAAPPTGQPAEEDDPKPPTAAQKARDRKELAEKEWSLSKSRETYPLRVIMTCEFLEKTPVRFTEQKDGSFTGDIRLTGMPGEIRAVLGENLLTLTCESTVDGRRVTRILAVLRARREAEGTGTIMCFADVNRVTLGREIVSWCLYRPDLWPPGWVDWEKKMAEKAAAEKKKK